MQNPLSFCNAHRAPLSHPGWQLAPGLLIVLTIITLTATGVVALLWQAPALNPEELWHSRYLRNVVVFTIWQALLSVLISTLLAIPVARALARQPQFPGRGLLLRLMELSLVMPSIVVVSGLVNVYGRQGWLTGVVSDFIPALQWNLYGLNGIVLAHVFFNAPLIARILLQALEATPQSQKRLASQMGLRGFVVWRVLDWPAMKPVLPGLLALVFTLCFTSFAIVMTLGGGPNATTLEVAIYQALRFEFDFGRAALLALVQLSICGGLWWLVMRLGEPTRVLSERRFSQPPPRRDNRGLARFCDGALVLAFAIFLLLPLLAIVTRGYPGLATLPMLDPQTPLFRATVKSLAIALPAGLLAVIATLAIVAAGQFPKAKMVTHSAGYLPLIVPPLVLGTGLFLLFRPSLGAAGQGMLLVALINAMMALPFILQLVRGPLASLDQPSRQLADQLGILGWYRWRWLHWPRLKRPLALALAYGVGLSLGDFGVIALFGSPGAPTLPVLLYQQLGSYQLVAAAATGLWLILLLLMIFSLAHVLTRAARLRSFARPQNVSVMDIRHA
ncbi:MAG: thiamine transport system permease protein [Marinobacter psychrophilus]|jgi:thiamine transport system permease protein|uniref:thiamine/thiamine pyrophosphate ABC transporter permease n=1 Tax=Marinobacter psychrophilus TaxID=330734 RepID=UPI0039E38BA1